MLWLTFWLLVQGRLVENCCTCKKALRFSYQIETHAWNRVKGEVSLMMSVSDAKVNLSLCYITPVRKTEFPQLECPLFWSKPQHYMGTVFLTRHILPQRDQSQVPTSNRRILTADSSLTKIFLANFYPCSLLCSLSDYTTRRVFATDTRQNTP